MRRFNAFEVCYCLQEIQNLHCELEAKHNSEGELFKTVGVLELACRVCNVADLGQAAISLSLIVDRLGPGKQHDLSTLKTELRHASAEIIRDISNHSFLSISPERDTFVDNEKLFGESVEKAFPSAVEDIKGVGNCLAAECNTAAVFHLMRVAEHGLRSLARDRRVKTLPKKGHPIGLATWEEIIRELETTELAIQSFPKSLAREAQFAFYHGAMMQFRRFKNVFRNRVMHTREGFDRTDALGMFENVRDFMQGLSRRISETNRTPIIWKGKRWTL